MWKKATIVLALALCLGCKEEKPPIEVPGQPKGELPALSKDSKVYHVSFSGLDSNPGTKEKPLKTLKACYSKLRDKFPDRCLLERGSTFHGGFPSWKISGRSAFEPIVIGAYGEGFRPVILLDGGYWLHKSTSKTCSNIFISDIEVRGKSPGVGYTFRWIDGGQDIIIQNSRFEGGFIVQHWRHENPKDWKLRYVEVHDAWSPGGRISGIYTSNVHGLVIEDSFFDHNGWGPKGTATMYNHNMYLAGSRLNGAPGSKNIYIRRNKIHRASSIGIKLSSLSERGMVNVEIEDNQFFEGEIGISAGGNGTMANRFDQLRIINNEFWNLGTTQPTGREFAWGIDIQDWISGQVINNGFLNMPDFKNKYLVKVTKGATPTIRDTWEGAGPL